MKTCTQCNVAKDETDFAFRDMQRGTRRSKCRECQNVQAKAKWASGQLKDSNYENKAKRKSQARWFVWTYLSERACSDCSENDPVVLEFDHIGSNKFESISRMVDSGYSIDRIAAEIEKCEVVCCNCHRRRTSTRAGWWRTVKN